MASRCVIWGMGEDYDEIVNALHFEIFKGNIEIIAGIMRKEDIVSPFVDGIKVCTADDLENLDFDWLIVASNHYWREIYKTAVTHKVPEDKIIRGKVFNLPNFDFALYENLLRNHVTILADDCWAGTIYHALGMKMYSPLVNIYWPKDSFMRFIGDVRYYLDCPLICEREAELGKSIESIGSLGTEDRKVFLHFVHSMSFAEAKSDWERRLKRINWDNIFVKITLTEQVPNYEKYLEQYKDLPYPKVCFFTKNLGGGVAYIKQFEQYIRKTGNINPLAYGHLLFDMSWFLKSVDLLKLLNGGNDFLRR